ncbi:ArsR/SmtB family transcription factor [Sphingomonas sp. 37zxx]|uniref:ArsR/SmtB family transcription factor n=1 Tax=Sphingomonas sp. 37zxx TaxID=1550073 RepID=UPI00053BF0D0|nr:metalloregulator ArsR/SmtB family transcription factor [Sphingomonas sp. 37zxx]
MTDIATLDLEASAELLRALAHGTRLALLRALIPGERSVGEIDQITNVGQPALSQQLGILRKAELVHTRREAKLVFYRINQDRIAEVSALLDAFAGTVAIALEQAAVTQLRSGSGAAMFARVMPRG